MAPAAAISSSDYVELERTECLGSCPAYTVRIQADGEVSWHGEKFVTVLGARTAIVKSSDAKSLIRDFRERDFWSLCNSYTQQITDLPAQVTTVRIGNHQKSVLNYADSAQGWLKDLDSQIDLRANTHRWRHGDSALEKLPLMNVFHDVIDPKQGVTDLMISAGRDDLDKVKELLANGADANAQDSSGWTALMYALQLAHKPVVDTLLEYGVDVRVRSSAGQTPSWQPSEPSMIGTKNLRCFLLQIPISTRRTRTAKRHS